MCFPRHPVPALLLAGRLALVAVPASFAVAVSPACTPGERQVVKTIVDAGLAACVAANADLKDPQLQAVCGFADDLWPAVRTILDGAKKGAKKTCAPAPGP